MFVFGLAVSGAVRASGGVNGLPAPPGQFVTPAGGGDRFVAIQTDPPGRAWAGNTAKGAARTTKARINGTNSLTDGLLNLYLHRVE